jgi:hypothetical protein
MQERRCKTDGLSAMRICPMKVHVYPNGDPVKGKVAARTEGDIGRAGDVS